MKANISIFIEILLIALSFTFAAFGRTLKYRQIHIESVRGPCILVFGNNVLNMLDIGWGYSVYIHSELM